MNNQIQPIIPDSQAVISCFDPEILKILDSHSTFTIRELLEKIKISGLDRTSFRNNLKDIIVQTQQENNNAQFLLNKLIPFIDGNEVDERRYTSYEILRKALLDGTECSLLKPDGKGWRNGKLKICFEFIPEESEPILIQENLAGTVHSPLDEIRQLVNNSSIDQN
jgi:KGK domain